MPPSQPSTATTLPSPRAPPAPSTPAVRPDMRYCFRSGRCRPNRRTKHISVPPRHMTKSYIPDFNMISQHYRYRIQHLIQSAYKCLNTIQQRKIHVWVQTTNSAYWQKVKHTMPTHTRVQALRPGTPS